MIKDKGWLIIYFSGEYLPLGGVVLEWEATIRDGLKLRFDMPKLNWPNCEVLIAAGRMQVDPMSSEKLHAFPANAPRYQPFSETRNDFYMQTKES